MLSPHKKSYELSFLFNPLELGNYFRFGVKFGHVDLQEHSFIKRTFSVNVATVYYTVHSV